MLSVNSQADAEKKMLTEEELERKKKNDEKVLAFVLFIFNQRGWTCLAVFDLLTWKSDHFYRLEKRLWKGSKLWRNRSPRQNLRYNPLLQLWVSVQKPLPLAFSLRKKVWSWCSQNRSKMSLRRAQRRVLKGLHLKRILMISWTWNSCWWEEEALFTDG